MKTAGGFSSKVSTKERSIFLTIVSASGNKLGNDVVLFQRLANPSIKNTTEMEGDQMKCHSSIAQELQMISLMPH